MALSRRLTERGPIDYTWFITSGIVSLLGITEDGASVEVAMAGCESVIGFPGSVRKNETANCSYVLRVPR